MIYVCTTDEEKVQGSGVKPYEIYSAFKLAASLAGIHLKTLTPE